MKKPAVSRLRGAASRQKHSIKYRGREVGIKLDLFKELKDGWCGQGLGSDVESGSRGGV